MSPDINTLKDHKTQQVEQIAQELVKNTGKLTFKNSCFPYKQKKKKKKIKKFCLLFERLTREQLMTTGAR